MDQEISDQTHLDNLIKTLETHPDLKAISKKIQFQNTDLFSYLIAFMADVDVSTSEIQKFALRYLNLFIKETLNSKDTFQLETLIPPTNRHIFYHTITAAHSIDAVRSPIYNRYVQTILKIMGSAEFKQSQQLIHKLTSMYIQKYPKIKSAAQFDNDFDECLNEDDKNLYDSILESQEQQIPITQQMELKEIRSNQFSKIDLSTLFSQQLMQFIESQSKQRPDLKISWQNNGGQMREFMRANFDNPNIQNNIQFINRYKFYLKMNDFYNNILMAYIDIPQKDERKQQKIISAHALAKSIESIIRNDLSTHPLEQQLFYSKDYYNLSKFVFNGQITKFYYRLLKQRTLDGKERIKTYSLKKILETQLCVLYEKYLQDQYKKNSEKFQLIDFYRGIYYKLQRSSSEIEFKEVLAFLFNVKSSIIQYFKYKFRYVFLSRIEQLADDYFRMQIPLEPQIENHFKMIGQILHQTFPIELGNLTQVFKSLQPPEYIMMGLDKSSEFIKKYGDRLKRDILNSDNIGDQIEIILNRTTNRILRIQAESNATNRPQEIFNDFLNFEEKLILGSKDIFGSAQDQQQFFKDCKLLNQRKDNDTFTFFTWYEYVKSKSNIMYQYVKLIQDSKISTQAINSIDYFNNKDPNLTLQKLIQINEKCQQTHDKNILQKCINRMRFEQKVSMQTLQFIKKLSNMLLLKHPKENYLKLSDQLNLHIKVLEDVNVGCTAELFYYHPSSLNLQKYLCQNEEQQKMLRSGQDLIEKFRFYSLILLDGDSPQTDKIQDQILKQISESFLILQNTYNNSDQIINKLPLDTQFILMQKLYNYIAEQTQVTTNVEVFIWKDPFPQSRLLTDSKPKPQYANTKVFNICCFITQALLQYKSEEKLKQGMEYLGNDLKILSEQKYQIDDIKTLQISSALPHIVSKYYTDIVKIKDSLTKESILLETTNTTVAEQFQKMLYDTFSKYFSKPIIMEIVNKKKLELKIQLNKDETLYEINYFYEKKYSQIFNSTLTDKQERIKNIKDYYSKIMEELKQIQKDGIEFYIASRQLIESQTYPQNYVKEFFSELLTHIQKFFQQVQQPTLVRPTPVRKTNQFVNEANIVKRTDRFRKRHEQENNLYEVFADKFVIFMKDFLSRILKVAVVQNSGDEIKIYQAQQSGIRHKAGLESDRNSESLVKQVTDLYNNYGPNKESDIDNVLLIEQNEMQGNRTQYSLCDITPQSRYIDFQKFIIDLDRQQEELLKFKLQTKRWRTERPELNDILAKKIKRGSDLGDALQVYFASRVLDMNRDQEQVEQNESVLDETEKIRSQIFEGIKFTTDNSQTKQQMQNKLRNLEYNNHLIKRKEVNVKTVQFVVEEMQMFRKSRFLMRSYLF